MALNSHSLLQFAKYSSFFFDPVALFLGYSTPYFDIASDVDPGPPLAYGGRVCVSWNKIGCMVCLGLLDPNLAQRDLEANELRRNREAVYAFTRISSAKPDHP